MKLITPRAYQFGIGISIAGTKSYVELDVAKTAACRGTFRYQYCIGTDKLEHQGGKCDGRLVLYRNR